MSMFKFKFKLRYLLFKMDFYTCALIEIALLQLIDDITHLLVFVLQGFIALFQSLYQRFEMQSIDIGRIFAFTDSH